MCSARCRVISVSFFDIHVLGTLWWIGASILRHPTWALEIPAGFEEGPGEAAHPSATSDRLFSPAEQCPAPWGLPVYPLATTPVVSVATPKFTQPGPPSSSMPTAYNTGECLCYVASRCMLLGQVGPPKKQSVFLGLPQSEEGR